MNIPDVLKSVMTYDSINQRISSLTSLVDSGQTPGIYQIKIETACQSALLNVQLQDSYSATITRPDSLGVFLLSFNENLSNFSEADYATILIDIERDG